MLKTVFAMQRQSLKKLARFEIVGLLIILAVGIFLNFYKLGEVPSGLYVDEALSGYNAYSILKTGKDEYGKLFPIAFRFFGSYSPPLYTYLTVLIISFFSLNIFATRTLSAICGVLMVGVVFLFLKNFSIIKNKHTPLLGTFLFAISPWHLLFARAGYELYLSFFLFSLGAFFVFKAFKNSRYWLYALPTLSLSTYSAHAERYLVPLFMVITFFLFQDSIWKKKSANKHLLVGILIAAIMQIPNIYLFTTPAFFNKSDLFYSQVVLNQSQKIRYLPSIISIPLAFAREFLSQYLTYFSPRSLFFLPDPDMQRSLPELAPFYSWMIVPYVVGFYIIFKNIKKMEVKYLLLLTAISPFLTTLVGDPFSTQRALPLLLPMILIITVGIDNLIRKVSFLRWLSVFIILICFSLLLLWRSYFVLLPGERATAWSFGFKQLASEISKRPNVQFVIDESRMKPAYIELAFFLKYPPKKFHQEIDVLIKNNYYQNTEFNAGYSFGNIETRNINWQNDIYKKQILVGDEFAVSEGQMKEHFLEKVFEIRSPIDEIIFVGYKTNPEMKCKADLTNIHCKRI
jgi:hypothetical protein